MNVIVFFLPRTLAFGNILLIWNCVARILDNEWKEYQRTQARILLIWNCSICMDEFENGDLIQPFGVCMCP